MGRDERMSAPDAGGGTLIKALVLRTDGSLPFIKEIPSQNEALAVLKEVITSPHGDWFDCVRGGNFHAYVNDTGLIDGLPLNPVASIIFGQIICGDVIFFGSYSPRGEYDGNEYSIPKCVVEDVSRHYFLWRTNADAQADRAAIEKAGGFSTWSPSADEFLQLIRSNGVSSEVWR